MEEKIKGTLKQLRSNESLISTLLGVLVVAVIGILLYRYFSQGKSPIVKDMNLELEESVTQSVKPGEVNEGDTPKGLPKSHQVEKGEHLWAIAERYYGSGYNWTDIAAANQLKNPDIIVAGSELTIPDIPAKLQTIKPLEVTVGSIAGDVYAVQTGDSLWTISVRAYGDGFQWQQLYEANKDKIGSDPNLIEKGIEILIPKIN